MAGTEIVYKCLFKDYNGIDCAVYVKQAGYAGAETEVNGGPEPCIISMMAEGDDKFVHIKATECKIQLVSSTSLQYLSLFTSTNKAYYIAVVRGNDYIWKGWINPEYYTEPFDAPPYVTTIIATDGLAELKNIPFPIPSYTVFKHSIISYISTCLEQIGDLDSNGIKVAVNIGATTTADGAVTARILEYLYIDYRSMMDDGQMWSCYDVLNEILSTVNARIFQFNNYWYIERISQKHTTYRVENYLLDGSYVSTSAAVDPVVSLTSHVGKGTDIRFLHSPAMLEVQPAYKRTTVNHEWGNRKNILKASSFDGTFTDADFASGVDLRYWDEDKGTETALITKVELTDDEIVLLMRPIPYSLTQVPSFTAFIRPIETGSPASPYVWTYNEGASDETNLMQWIYGYGTCRFSYKVFANLETYFTSEPKLRSYVRININCSGTIYRLWTDQDSIIGDPNAYEWVETVSGTPVTYGESHITVTPNKGAWMEVDLNLQFPAAEVGNAQTYVGFLVEISSPNLNAATVATSGDGLYYKDVKIYFTEGTENDLLDTSEGRKIAEKKLKINLSKSRIEYENKEVEYSKDHIYEINANNILEPETYNVKYGDGPAPYADDGYGLVNKYVLFDSGGAAVNLFGQVNTPPYTPPEYSLVEQIIGIMDLTVTYRLPLFKLRGTIIDTTKTVSVLGLGFESTLKDYNDRYYCPIALSYNLKDSTFEGEWLQIWSEASTGGEFNDDFSDDFFT